MAYICHLRKNMDGSDVEEGTSTEQHGSASPRQSVKVSLAVKSKQEIRDDGKDWGCERENKEMSLDPRLVKAFVEEICDKTKTSWSFVQHDGQENNDLGKKVRLRCTWVGEEYYLN